MSTHRKGPVGPGFMPKGGAAAARAHNEEVRERPVSDVDVIDALAAVPVRASATAWRLPFAAGVVSASLSWYVGLLIGGVY